MTAAYSLRGRDQPTASTPITREEVSACHQARQFVFTADEVLDRIDEVGDLLQPLLGTTAPLSER
ncbi:hypothetical protein [Amycolatopsis sp. NPDC050768]|uniref:non-homologous end-joining DNA ligase LigD n=1 Tax=unclassified Amycolatopsis TaxID=2618356 RepID=UPI0033D7B8BB